MSKEYFIEYEFCTNHNFVKGKKKRFVQAAEGKL